MILILPSLFAAAALGVASPEGSSAEAAENFVRTCLDTGGERSAVSELARTRQWLAVETAPRAGVVWMDAYRTGESVVALYLTPASDPPPSAPAGIPNIRKVPTSRCLVALQTPTADWHQAATLLDALDQLIPFPETLQPAEGEDRTGAVRYYALSELRGIVTVSQNRALGFLEISIVRGVQQEAAR